MRMVAIGHSFSHESVSYIDYISNDSLLDFDCVLWNPNRLMSEFGHDTSNLRDHWIIQHDHFPKLKESIQRREQEMRNLLSQNRTLIVAIPAPTTYASNISNVRGVEILEIFPFQSLITKKGRGKRIENKASANEEYREFVKATQQSLMYEAYLETPKGEPLLYIEGTNHVIGFKLPTENGLLLFLPFPENGNTSTNNNYITSIVQLISKIKNQKTVESLPQWSDSYRFEAELDLKKELLSEETQLYELQAKIDTKKQSILKLEQLKHLFAGTGDSLENQVEVVLTELGFEIKQVQGNRDDLIVEFDGKTAVIEVKGVTKSAKEGNAAQLEKWVSQYITEHDEAPKGILIVNAFKDKPLQDRSEPTFPHQMHQYSVNRGHCLITGLQLFGLYLDCLNNSERKQVLIDKLFNTIGVFEGYEDWTQFLTRISDTPAS